MNSNQPITDAIYKRSTQRKPNKPQRRRQVGTLVRDIVGPDVEAALYRRFGRPKRARGRK